MLVVVIIIIINMNPDRIAKRNYNHTLSLTQDQFSYSGYATNVYISFNKLIILEQYFINI